MDRTDEQKATDYTNMGHSVTIINNLITGDASVIGDMTEAHRKEKVKRKSRNENNVKSYSHVFPPGLFAAQCGHEKRPKTLQPRLPVQRRRAGGGGGSRSLRSHVYHAGGPGRRG